MKKSDLRDKLLQQIDDVTDRVSQTATQLPMEFVALLDDDVHIGPDMNGQITVTIPFNKVYLDNLIVTLQKHGWHLLKMSESKTLPGIYVYLSLDENDSWFRSPLELIAAAQMAGSKCKIVREERPWQMELTSYKVVCE